MTAEARASAYESRGGRDSVWTSLREWLLPHPAMPKATARKGTTRTPKAVRALLGRRLPREAAAELIRSGELSPSSCSIVWNVAGRPVVQPVRDAAIPPGREVLPVRRIGTHREATSLISMYPVVRDGCALMLSVESKGELAWLQQLDFDPRVSALYAQPFAMVWRHAEGNLVCFPDLAAVLDGRLNVFEVKPGHRMRDEWTRLTLDCTAHTFALAGIPFRVLGDVSRQRAHNLMLLARYREPNAFLADEVAAVIAAKPATAGGLVGVVEAAVRTSEPLPPSGCPVDVSCFPVANEVLKHLIATGRCHADLDAPINLGTELSWDTRESLWGWVA